jgi:hypothetical protein
MLMAETFRLTCFSYLGYSKAHANSFKARNSRVCEGNAGGNARKAATNFRVAPGKRQPRLPLLHMGGNGAEEDIEDTGRPDRWSALSFLTVAEPAAPDA